MAALTHHQAVQWAIGFLNELGQPAKASGDARVNFLAAQAMHEGTNATFNPLAITGNEGVASTNLSGNTAGVKNFNSMHDGYVALHRYLVNQGITGYLSALTNPNATIQDLTSALAGAGWEGSSTPKSRAASLGYANAIGAAAGGTPIAGSLAGFATAPSGPAPRASGGGSGGGAVPGAVNVNDIAQVGNPGVMKVRNNYAGPGAYRGFDLQAIPSQLRQQTINAINAVTANPAEMKQIESDIMNHYGEMSWIASDPQVFTVLVASAYNSWATKDPATFQGALIATSWWKHTSDNQRLWQETLANDPGQAHVAVQEAQSRVINIANSLGVQLSQADLTKIATTVAQQSVSKTGGYSSTNFTDQQIYEAVVGKFNANTFTGSMSGTTTPGARTATTASGDAATLYNQFTTIARNYYLNLTPDQISQEVQKYLQTDTGEPNFMQGATQGFTTFAETQAKQMYPAMASLFGSGGTAGTDTTPYAATGWARNMIAQFTGLGSGDNVNLMDPRWSWVLSGKQPPAGGPGSIPLTSPTGTAAPSTSSTAANSTPTIPSADQLQTYLMSTPEFQKTNMAKDMGWSVGSQLLKSFGY